jgi:hypothetical protein
LTDDFASSRWAKEAPHWQSVLCATGHPVALPHPGVRRRIQGPHPRRVRGLLGRPRLCRFARAGPGSCVERTPPRGSPPACAARDALARVRDARRSLCVGPRRALSHRAEPRSESPRPAAHPDCGGSSAPISSFTEGETDARSSPTGSAFHRRRYPNREVAVADELAARRVLTVVG